MIHTHHHTTMPQIKQSEMSFVCYVHKGGNLPKKAGPRNLTVKTPQGKSNAVKPSETKEAMLLSETQKGLKKEIV